MIQPLPEATRARLAPLVGVGHTHEAELVAALARALTPEERKRHQAALVKQATVTKGGGPAAAPAVVAADGGPDDDAVGGPGVGVGP